MKRFAFSSILFVLLPYSTTLYADNDEIVVCSSGYTDAQGNCKHRPSNYEHAPISVIDESRPIEITPVSLELQPIDLSGYTSDGQPATNPESVGNGGTLIPAGDNSAPASNTFTSTPPPSGMPTQTIGSTGAESRVTTLESKLRQCKAKLKETAQCCENPMSCLTGESGGQHSGVLMALQVAAGTATSMASISGSCGTLGTISTGMAAINTALAFKCSSKINQCNSTCGSIVREAEEMSSSCQSQSGGCVIADNELEGAYECDGTGKAANYERSCLDSKRRRAQSNLVSRLDKIADSANQCDTYGGRAVEQQSQAIASMYAAKVAGLCKKAANTTDTAANNSNNAFNVNCSDPTNAANPVCQNQCNRANAANDPVCAQLLGLGTSGFGSGTGTDGLANGSLDKLGTGSIDEFEDPQSLNDPNIAAAANSAKVGSAGGGGIPGGGGGSTAGGGEGGSGGGGEGGLNTNIMGGAASRSGYTNPYMRSSLGGGGYSAEAGRAPASEKGKPFNPRDFLPGGKLDPKRKLAGLASATPEIGAVHGNIFTNITNRFLQVCLRDGLFDCETLRKNSKPRN